MRTGLLLLFVTCAPRAFGQAPAPVSAGFQSLLTGYYEDFLKLNPTTASYLGDYRYNDQLENTFSQPYRDQMKGLFTRYLDRLNAYDEKQLGERDKLNYQILRYDLTTNLASMEFPEYLTPMNQMGDFRLSFSQMGSGSDIHPFKSVKDYDDFLKRINGFVAQTDTAIANMRTGMAQNYMQPKVVIGKVLPQIKAMLVDDVTKSLFYGPVEAMPATFSAGDKQRLTTAYTTAIREQIIPAYSRLYTFLQNEYLLHCRETVGLSAMLNGKAQYAYLVKSSTTTNMTPDQVHALGLSEVNRIRQQMETIKQQVGFTGDLNAFFTYLATDPKFFPYKTDEDVVNAFQHDLPDHEAAVAESVQYGPENSLRDSSGRERTCAASSSAYYMTGTPDGSRPGVFYFPVLDAAKRSVTGVWKTCFCTRPFRVTTTSVRSKTKTPLSLPFRKLVVTGLTRKAGGLYAESLGKALGLYTDPFQMLGRYQGEMHRAIRLVVDTGIHQKGWTREQAIQYSLANEPITEAEGYSGDRALHCHGRDRRFPIRLAS